MGFDPRMFGPFELAALCAATPSFFACMFTFATCRSSKEWTLRPLQLVSSYLPMA